MLKVEESIVINHPVNEVFTYLTDARNWPYWTSSVLEAEQTSVGQMSVGTTFRGIDRIICFRVAWTSRIMEYELNRKMSHSIVSGTRVVEQHLTFDSIESGTKFNFVYDMKTSGLPKFIEPIMLRIMRRTIKKNLRKLKLILET